MTTKTAAALAAAEVELERRWQALKDYLCATIDADAKVFDSFAGTPQQPAFGGLLTANRNTLAKMAYIYMLP